MTKREAAIVAAYTGYLIGSFDDLQRYADEKMGHTTWTHMFASEEFTKKLREKSKEDFIAIDVL